MNEDEKIALRFLLFFMISCRNDHPSSVENNSSSIITDTDNTQPDFKKINDSIEFKIEDKQLLGKDTLLLHFSFNNFSSEGAEGFAWYADSTLQKVMVTSYGEMYQDEVKFLFEKDEVHISEINYLYKNGNFTTAKNDSDRIVENSIQFSISRDGGILNNYKVKENSISMSLWKLIQIYLPYKMSRK